jgi:hypothetical protein
VFGSKRQEQTVVYRSLLVYGSLTLSCGCLLLRRHSLLLGYTCSLQGLLHCGQDLSLHILTGKGLAIDTAKCKIRLTCSRWIFSVKSGRDDWNSSRAFVREFCEELVISRTSQIRTIPLTHLRDLDFR